MLTLRFSLSILFFLTCTTVNAQIRTLFYNLDWEITTQDSAVYYRTCRVNETPIQFLGEVKDFTIDGQLIMTGFYDRGKKNGAFTFYYPSGQMEAQGKFIQDERQGDWIYYHPKGKLWREVKFNKGDFFVSSQYDADGNQSIKDGTGEWVHSYAWYNAPQKFEVRGAFVNGKKEGEWVCRFENGDFIYKETFKGDKFKKGFYTNMDGSPNEEFKEEHQNKFLIPFKFGATEQFNYRKGIFRTHYPFLVFLRMRPLKMDSISDSKKVFLIVESPPEYEGGIEAMLKFISSNLKYPAEARKQRTEGRVFVGFVIDTDGSITDVSIIKGISKECDVEAMRIVSSFPKWRPGTQQGKPVRVKFVLPINFQL